MNIDASGEQITNVQDIFRTLKTLELTRGQLTLKLAGDRHSYASLLLHTDLRRRQFTIDEVNPTAGNGRIAAGEPFTVIAYSEGVRVIFKSRHRGAKGPRRFDSAFTVDFPAYIYHKQRRNAYRAAVPGGAVAHIELRSKSRPRSLRGELTDLSCTGAGCRFSGTIKPELEKREYFEDCTVIVGAEFELPCALIARRPQYHKALGSCSCGFQFAGLNRFQQKALDRYVLAIQRRARRDRIGDDRRIPAL